MIVRQRTIEIEIEKLSHYKGRVYYDATVWINGASWSTSRDTLDEAERWAAEKVDSTFSTPARVSGQATCRCDGADMQGSDHCPQCGCEEYEETCRPHPTHAERVQDAGYELGDPKGYSVP